MRWAALRMWIKPVRGGRGSVGLLLTTAASWSVVGPMTMTAVKVTAAAVAPMLAGVGVRTVVMLLVMVPMLGVSRLVVFV